MTGRVVHCKREKYDVYIGRPSKWGNPFHVDPMVMRGPNGEAARRKVIAAFEQWVQKQPRLMASLHELRGKTLGCYCAPKACHGDVLLRLVQEDEEYENLEREHLGDPEKKTGIYAPR